MLLKQCKKLTYKLLDVKTEVRKEFLLKKKELY